MGWRDESKKEFLEESSWRRMKLHLDKQALEDLQELKDAWNLQGDSAHIRKAMRMAVEYIPIRQNAIDQRKKLKDKFQIQDWEEKQ